MKCEAIFAHSSGYSVRKMCKAPGLREAVYCRWKKAEERRSRRIREEREKKAAEAAGVDMACGKALGCDPAGCAECVRAAAAQR